MSEQSVEDLFKEAERTGDYLMVQIDNDPEWVAIRWTSEVYDGSPYGCEGFADEDNQLVLSDVATAARWPEDSDGLPHISSPFERNEERREHYAEAEAARMIEERAERKRRTAERRAILEERHRAYFPDNHDQSQLTMAQMRSEIDAKVQEGIGRSLQAIFRLG